MVYKGKLYSENTLTLPMLIYLSYFIFSKGNVNISIKFGVWLCVRNVFYTFFIYTGWFVLYSEPSTTLVIPSSQNIQYVTMQTSGAVSKRDKSLYQERFISQKPAQYSNNIELENYYKLDSIDWEFIAY